MATIDTERETPDYAAMIAGMEQELAERAPGVLDLLETYQHSAPVASWRPLNSGPVVYATETTMPAPR
jgi:hypothetical protein